MFNRREYNKWYQKTYREEIRARKKIKSYWELEHRRFMENKSKQPHPVAIKNKNLKMDVWNVYMRNKRKNDLKFKIGSNLRSRIRASLSGKPKVSTTMKLVGCSIQLLKQHLEKHFTSGMSWSNYGYSGWHIDHIKPCAKFDLKKVSEQYKCFHYTNLQPLWAKDNLSKGSKIL
jgi:hypothetical protein